MDWQPIDDLVEEDAEVIGHVETWNKALHLIFYKGKWRHKGSLMPVNGRIIKAIKWPEIKELA